jgi:hypothetical protein
VSNEELEDALLAYFAKDDAEERDFQSLTTIFELLQERSKLTADHHDDDEVEDKQRIRTALRQLVNDGLLESRQDERDYEALYRLTDDGVYAAAGFDPIVTEIPANAILTEKGEPLTTEDGDFIVMESQAGLAGLPLEIPEVEKLHDSTLWTGKQLVLVDVTIIAEVKAAALKLHSAVHSMRFESNSDSMDLKGLVDALIAICDMAEPEVTIIDRILSNPKFKTYAALLAFVATVRGAAGI